jgi:hypothetical protein
MARALANGDRRCAYIPRVRALAVICAAFAVILMIIAIAGMVTGRPSDKAGGVIRALALALFVAAVVLNVASR